MAIFPLDCVLRGFPAAAYVKYASPQTLVRPCPAKKLLIYGLDTLQCHQKAMDGHQFVHPNGAKLTPSFEFTNGDILKLVILLRYWL